MINNEIKGFFGDYRWLSNFHLCDVYYKDVKYSSSENAYQAAKLHNRKDRIVLESLCPAGAKKYSKTYTKDMIRVDWVDVRLDIMREILISKFTLNEDLKGLLISTGDKYLEETNNWRDIFWGVCDDIGQNNLGKILMNIRKELRTKSIF